MELDSQIMPPLQLLRIIRDGQIAHEDGAKLTIKVARKVVEIVASLTDSPQR